MAGKIFLSFCVALLLTGHPFWAVVFGIMAWLEWEDA